MASIEKTQDAGKPYRVRWRDPDGRARTRRCPDHASARALKLDVEQALARGRRWEPPDASAPAEPPDLWRLVDDHLIEEKHKRAARTMVRKQQMIQAWLEWLEARLGRTPQAGDLSRSMLLEYIEHLEDPETGRHLHGRGYATVRKHLCEVELCWRRVWRADELGIVPRPQTLELPAQPPAERPAPTWSEMDLAIAAATGWHRELAIVLRCTGLRVDQAMGLRWSDLDLGTGVLHVRPELGKSRQEKTGRYVPVARALLVELNRWLQDGTADPEWLVSCSRTHREARARDMDRAWSRAGVRPATWDGRPHHAFRAGFMAGLKRAGADDEAVRFLVGHSRGVRASYVDGTALPLREAVDQVPELELRRVIRLEDHR